MPEDRQGTGKHAHKSTEEPFHHTEDNQQKGSERNERRSQQQSASSGSSQSDLKQREYRDQQGNIHHHTKTYEEQHGRDKGKKAA